MAQAAAIPIARRRTGPWLLAGVLSLLLHVLGVAGLVWLNPFAADALPERDDPVMEFVFEPEPAADETRAFTELPEDRADAPPERADLLSNVDSRARDAAPGGEEQAPPRSEGLADFPAVAMNPAAGGGAEAERPEPQARPEPETSPRGEEGLVAAAIPRPHPLAAFRGLGRAAADLQPDAPEAGAQDTYQAPADTPAGNAELDGDISLSTEAWDFAPWLQRFQRAVRKNWYPPYAFQIGMIDGWTRLELEVSRSGELLRLRVLGEEGQGSLRESSVGALRAAAPFAPLPAHFPEETLTITLKMSYLNAALARSRR